MHPAEYSRLRFERAMVRGMTRRGLIAGTGAAAAAALTLSLPGRPTRVSGQGTPEATPVSGALATFPANPFTLGVASGDPLPDGVVLWTRLAPAPLVGGGMDPVPYEVRWEVADDEGFGSVVRSGTSVASPTLAHSVHVDVTGLEPGRAYFYRFMAGGEVSPTGRTRTAPAAGSPVESLRFAFASCQNFEEGYFTSYPHIVADDVDLVFFLGDYTYEYEGGAYGEEAPREHVGGETATLADYRNRQAQYKTDPSLQAAHAAFPWVVTWDDHEVDNDYADEFSEDEDPIDAFLARRAASYQAVYEHLPLRPSSFPTGPDMLLYRKLAWGDLAEFNVLDTRQYRTNHPCGDGEQVRCPAAYDPATTMTGPEQERWLLQNLDASQARWNILAQQVLMAELLHQPEPEVFWTDSWDGYPAARNRILSHIMSRGISNPVVITGDWHSTFINDLKADFDDDTSETIASEFVVTSVSSNGDAGGYQDYYGPMIQYNPHIKLFDGDRRGYQQVEVTPERMRVDIQMVDTVLSETAGVSTFASFVVEDGVPGPQQES